jgi:hypothetical protein
MTTDNELRVFNHLLRMTSVLVIIEMDEEKGVSHLALAGNLATARQYLTEHCPNLLLFTELCYRQQPIPQGLSQLAENEAVCGRQTVQ